LSDFSGVINPPAETVSAGLWPRWNLYDPIETNRLFLKSEYVAKLYHRYISYTISLLWAKKLVNSRFHFRFRSEYLGDYKAICATVLSLLFMDLQWYEGLIVEKTESKISRSTVPESDSATRFSTLGYY
jgi:hypothetical protein